MKEGVVLGIPSRLNYITVPHFGRRGQPETGQSRVNWRRPFPFVRMDSEVIRKGARWRTFVIPAQAGIQSRLWS
jgi:hypothetical protein